MVFPVVKQIGYVCYPIAYDPKVGDTRYLMVKPDGNSVGSSVADLTDLLDNTIRYNGLDHSQIQMDISDTVFERAKGKNFPSKDLRPLTSAEANTKPRVKRRF